MVIKFNNADIVKVKCMVKRKLPHKQHIYRSLHKEDAHSYHSRQCARD